MPTKTNKSPFTIPTALIGMGVKGLVGGFGEVLRDRKEAKDAGEIDLFDFVFVGIIYCFCYYFVTVSITFF